MCLGMMRSMTRQNDTYDATCFKVLAYEFEFDDPKDSERKIRAVSTMAAMHLAKRPSAGFGDGPKAEVRAAGRGAMVSSFFGGGSGRAWDPMRLLRVDLIGRSCTMLIAVLLWCGADVKRESIVVPQNRRANDETRMVLFYRRIGPHRPDRTVFHFMGGPGMSNLKQVYPDSLLREFSIVEVGYRGIDSSSRLSCDAIDRALTPPGTLGPASARALAEAVASCFDEWKHRGLDLGGYQLRDVIDDAEALRQSLGVGRVHLMGDSYGTRLALYYESLYPQSIGRTILVGANPPGHFFWSAADVTAAFAGYQPFFEKAHPQYVGRVTLERLCADALARAPRTVWGMRLDPFRVRATAFVLLFHARTSSLALDSFMRAYERQDYSGLMVLSQLYDLMLTRSFDVWGDFFVKGLLADYDTTRDYASESSAAAGRFGSPLGEMLFAPPYPSDLFAFRDEPIALDIRTPTLIMAGSLDFSTPAATSQRELADRFPSFVTQVTFPAKGHVADFWGEGDSFGSIAARFLDHGEVPDAAALTSRPVIFSRRLGLAHIPIALLGILVAVGSVLTWIFQRVRRRRPRATTGLDVLP